MKHPSYISMIARSTLLSTLLLAGSALHAEAETTQPAKAEADPIKIDSPRDAIIAERILTASPEELERLRKLIEHIEKMSAEEKLQAIERIRADRPGFRAQRQALGNLSEEQREKLRNMTPEQRRAAFQKMRGEQGEGEGASEARPARRRPAGPEGDQGPRRREGGDRPQRGGERGGGEYRRRGGDENANAGERGERRGPREQRKEAPAKSESN